MKRIGRTSAGAPARKWSQPAAIARTCRSRIAAEVGVGAGAFSSTPFCLPPDLEIPCPDHVWCADVTCLPCAEASSIWSRSWNGQAARCSPGGFRTPWMPAFASRLWRRRWPVLQARYLQYRSGQPVHQQCLHRCAACSRDQDEHGRPRWMDNVFIERLWRSVKYECIYLHAFETGI